RSGGLWIRKRRGILRGFLVISFRFENLKMCRFENCSPTENENSSSNLQINQFSNRFAPGCSGKLRAPAPVVFPWRRSDLGSSRGRVENRLREAHLSGRP